MITSLEVTVNHLGQAYETYVEIGQYANGRVAVQLYEKATGNLHGTVTVNLPYEHLGEGEVFVKDWDDNGAMVSACVAAGWMTDTGRTVGSGYVSVRVMTLTGALANYIKENA